MHALDNNVDFKVALRVHCNTPKMTNAFKRLILLKYYRLPNTGTIIWDAESKETSVIVAIRITWSALVE